MAHLETGLGLGLIKYTLVSGVKAMLLDFGQGGQSGEGLGQGECGLGQPQAGGVGVGGLGVPEHSLKGLAGRLRIMLSHLDLAGAQPGQVGPGLVSEAAQEVGEGQVSLLEASLSEGRLSSLQPLAGLHGLVEVGSDGLRLGRRGRKVGPGAAKQAPGAAKQSQKDKKPRYGSVSTHK